MEDSNKIDCTIHNMKIKFTQREKIIGKKTINKEKVSQTWQENKRMLV